MVEQNRPGKFEVTVNGQGLQAEADLTLNSGAEKLRVTVFAKAKDRVNQEEQGGDLLFTVDFGAGSIFPRRVSFGKGAPPIEDSVASVKLTAAEVAAFNQIREGIEAKQQQTHQYETLQEYLYWLVGLED